MSKVVSLCEIGSTDKSSIFRLVLNNDFYEINVFNELSITLETLDEDILNHSQKYLVIANAYEIAKGQADQLSLELKTAEAQTFLDIKDIPDSNGKPYSDARVSMLVDTDEKVLKLKRDFLQMSGYARQLSHYLEAFRQRKDLMQTYSSNLRKTV